MKEVSRVVSVTAYCQIMAGIELGRRVAEAMRAEREPPMKINSSTAAIEFCRRTFARLAADRRQEEFHIVTLDTKLFPIRTHQITVGTLDASLVHPREVFRAAIRDAASSVLLVHNHPSGDPTPSREDFEVTQNARDCRQDRRHQRDRSHRGGWNQRRQYRSAKESLAARAERACVLPVTTSALVAGWFAAGAVLQSWFNAIDEAHQSLVAIGLLQLANRFAFDLTNAFTSNREDPPTSSSVYA